jgi:hypothetical protein
MQLRMERQVHIRAKANRTRVVQNLYVKNWALKVLDVRNYVFFAFFTTNFFRRISTARCYSKWAKINGQEIQIPPLMLYLYWIFRN